MTSLCDSMDLLNRYTRNEATPVGLTSRAEKGRRSGLDGRARLREIHFGDSSTGMIHYNTAGLVDWCSDEDSVTQTYT